LYFLKSHFGHILQICFLVLFNTAQCESL
jgi:hypothetical protein